MVCDSSSALSCGFLPSRQACSPLEEVLRCASAYIACMPLEGLLLASLLGPLTLVSLNWKRLE